MDKVTKKIIEILKLIPTMGLPNICEEKQASIILDNGRELLRVSPLGILVGGISMTSKLFNRRSPLPDNFVPNDQISKLLDRLTTNHLFQRLNHLGICYSVKSIVEEKNRLKGEFKKSSWHLYEESSNDDSTWLFVGDIANWQDPLIELVLIEQTNDRWKDYWLPHFQLDIDTFLNGDEIEQLIKDIFQGKVKPFRIIETEKFIVLVRARLGVISGININLDMGFEGRMTRYHRTQLLSKLI